MSPAKQYERIPQTFAFRAFVYGQRALTTMNTDTAEVDDFPIVQRRIPAGAPMSFPSAAVSSIFEAGKKAKIRAKRGPACPPPEEVQILKGVPVPQNPQAARRKDVYGDLIKRMGDGDMVVLEALQARSMRARAKKLGIEVTLRVLDNGKVGVWRLREIKTAGVTS